MIVECSVDFRLHRRAPLLVALALAGVSVTGCLGADVDGQEAGDGPAARPEADLSPAVRVESDAELSRMRKHLASRYDEADVAHAFTLPSGDAVDCVALERQPGLRRAEMRGHAIAAPPSAPVPEGAAEAPPDVEGTEAFLQPGRRDAAGVELSCPEGTVPIRRVTIDDLARYRTLEDRLLKSPRDLDGGAARDPSQGHLFLGQPAASGIEAPLYGPTSTHQYAHAAQHNLHNVGAHTRINVWNPHVQASTEFSLSQLWVVGGSGGNLQTLEAGVQKYVNLYGNAEPHLFIYSTSDGYGPAGCYNLDCGRFVQVSNTALIGATLSPSSITGGAQYEMELAWFLSSGNWWLKVNGAWIGYYPGSLFNAAGLASGASVIDFGGEIIDDRGQHGYHTYTAMGSGAYPAARWQKAAFQRNIWYYPNTTTAYHATGLTAYRDNAYCYDIALYNNDPSWGTYFFYGGPGYNTNCQ